MAVMDVPGAWEEWVSVVGDDRASDEARIAAIEALEADPSALMRTDPSALG